MSDRVVGSKDVPADFVDVQRHVPVDADDLRLGVDEALQVLVGLVAGRRLPGHRDRVHDVVQRPSRIGQSGGHRRFESWKSS